MKMTIENLNLEFDRQVKNLIYKGYPVEAGISEIKFLTIINSLKENLDTLSVESLELNEGYLPFVIVVKNNLISTVKAMELVEFNGKNGITKLFPHKPTDFKVIDAIELPDSEVYMLVDIDRGKGNINIPPNEAINLIKQINRLPITIDEGIAIMTQFPDFLMKNNCFSLLASRTGKDQRVPAIWINAKKEPNLGWCWDGNPHTWLGSASCKYRLV